MTGKFKLGDTVYTDDARECVYFAPAHDGHIVRAVLDCDDEGPDLGPPEVHFSVSASPPNDRYSAEVADAKAKLDAMRTEISTARQELATLTSGREAALKALASHPQLAPVVEYIEGKLTHAAVFGVYGTGIRIMTIEDAVTPGNTRSKRKASSAYSPFMEGSMAQAGLDGVPTTTT